MGSGSYREASAVADYGVPLADAPGFDQAISNVWIGVGKRLGGLRGRAAKHQHGAVCRLRECTGDDQLTAIMGLLDEREMPGAEGAATIDVIVHNVIEEKKVHCI